MSNRVLEILKQKFHPNEYEAEQKAKLEAADKLHAERLEFIEGFKEMYTEHQERVEKSKSKPLLVSDYNSKWFKPAYK